MTTTLVLPDPDDRARAPRSRWPWPPATRPTPSRMASFRQAIAVDGQARRLVRDRGRHGHRAGHPRAHRGPLPGPRPGRRGVRRAAVGAAAGAGSSTPSTAPTTTCAACPSSRRCWRSRSTASSVVGVVSAPALHRRWFAWRGGGAWAADVGPGRLATATRRCPSRVSGVDDLAAASLVYSSAAQRPGLAAWRRASWTCWATSGATAAWATSMATCWSPRAPPRPWSRPT